MLKVKYKLVPDFGGAYRIGNDGSAWTRMEHRIVRDQDTGRILGSRTVLVNTWHQMQTVPNCVHGYHLITLRKNNKSYSKRVHILVMKLFGPPRPSPAHEVRHFPDPDKANNSVANLCWGTAKENSADKVIHGTDRRGSAIACAKLHETDIPVIRGRLAAGETTVSIAGDYKVNPAIIQRINHRLIWKHVP